MPLFVSSGVMSHNGARLLERRLEWLGHKSRMENHRLSKIILFGWLTKARPLGGPSKRWRDQVKEVQVQLPVDSMTQRSVLCLLCSRSFWRPQELKRQKCKVERGKPIQDQKGSADCGCWFNSRGVRSRHRCVNKEPAQEVTRDLKCAKCKRLFKRSTDKKSV